ncbi:MAG: biotin synthase BioB [Planctomycetota bacterium]|jgi:biotin synthase
MSLVERSVNWTKLAERVLEGTPLSRREARSILECPDEDLDALLGGAFLIRSRHFGRGVRLQVLLNARSGRCSEDCSFCSQSAHASSDVDTYPLLSKEKIVEAARKAKEMNAWRFCIATAEKGPTDGDLDVLCEAVREIRGTIGIRVCTSIGLLRAGQAERLKDAGVDRFNHNLETSERHFANVTTTHGYADRVDTVRKVRDAGVELCCGGLIGMGEGPDDVVDLAFALKDLGVESIPVNFLDPRPGTGLADRPLQDPKFCLKVLCMFRYVHPDREIRMAGGREVNLRDEQPRALYAANSMFTDGYLTTGGNPRSKDVQMIEDAGFEVAAG